MLDIKKIKENSSDFDEAMKFRKSNIRATKILELFEDRQYHNTLIQQLNTAGNAKADLIANIKDKFSPEADQARDDAKHIREKRAELQKKIDDDNEYDQMLSMIPNIPLSDVPVGDETCNKEIRNWGTIPKFSFAPLQHFVIGEKLGMMDFEQAAKMSGSRFVILKKQLAKLERALANFMLDVSTSEHGYIEVSVPHLVKDKAMFGAGQLPKFADDSFVTNDYRLIPTGEVPLVNLVADQILKEEELPKYFTSHSLCFRSEAGSAGRDTRGMIRVHQFSKVELVVICKPEDSEKEHEKLTNIAENILQKLKLPYRVVLLSTEDMGFTSQKTYDLEVWLPGQDKYREISSCSNCGDFQARRMKTRYRSGNSKDSIFVHTLNGSSLAIGRTIAAILENYQNADGSVTIPEVLRPYMGGLEKITA